MKFKSKSANEIVWDVEKNKALCEFKNYELETNNKRIIDLLIKNGYESDAEVIEHEVIDNGWETEQGDTEGQEVEGQQEIDLLRQQAKEKGIKGFQNMKYETLIERLKEGAENE